MTTIINDDNSTINKVVKKTSTETYSDENIEIYIIQFPLTYYYNYDMSSVEPRRDDALRNTSILSEVNKIVDPSNIPDEVIFKAMVQNDIIVNMKPKTRKKVLVKVVNRRKGVPPFVRKEDTL